MFETAEVGNQIPKAEYEALVPQLRLDLLNAQFDLRDADFPVILLLAGDDRIGGDEVVDILHEWTDARFIRTTFFAQPSDEERERPRFWRYWRNLPPKGRIGLFIGAWARNAIADRVADRITESKLERRIGHIRRFEQALVDDGALVLKVWLHLPKKEYKKRIKSSKNKANGDWRVEEDDRAIFEVYDEAMPVIQQVLRKTSTASAPWHIVESTNRRYRDLYVARLLHTALTARLEEGEQAAAPAPKSPRTVAPVITGRDALSAVDLDASLTREEYKDALAEHQRRLGELSRRARRERLSSLLLFEGWDAAGKGGVIRRMTRPMTARDYELVPIAAPTEEEKAHHYLWRFWRHIPGAGRMLIFDRTWYGRVLVERVEGYAREEEWQRAYEEINDFEEQLVEHGMPVLKFWLHIDPDEQLDRFKARENTAFKKHKITDEDYRNRDKWNDYVAALNEMVARTSTEIVPWYLVAANDKRWARIEVLKRVCDALERGLGD